MSALPPLPPPPRAPASGLLLQQPPRTRFRQRRQKKNQQGAGLRALGHVVGAVRGLWALLLLATDPKTKPKVPGGQEEPPGCFPEVVAGIWGVEFGWGEAVVLVEGGLGALLGLCCLLEHASVVFAAGSGELTGFWGAQITPRLLEAIAPRCCSLASSAGGGSGHRRAKKV